MNRAREQKEIVQDRMSLGGITEGSVIQGVGLSQLLLWYPNVLQGSIFPIYLEEDAQKALIRQREKTFGGYFWDLLCVVRDVVKSF